MGKRIRVANLKVGYWIKNGKLSNLHVEEIELREDGKYLIRCNFGSGFPGITSIRDADSWIDLV